MPRSIRPDVPEEVERVILKALAKNPDDRFQTVMEMVRALDAAVRSAETSAPMKPTVGQVPTEVVVTRPEADVPTAVAGRVREVLTSRWSRVAALAGLGVVLLLVLSWALWWRKSGGEQKQALLPTMMVEAAAPSTPTAAGLLVGGSGGTATVNGTSTSSSQPTETARALPATLTPVPGSMADQARAFAEPILQAIADRPPDFEDDFSNPGSGWDIGERGPSEDGWEYGETGYTDGEYFIAANPGYCREARPHVWPEFSDLVLEIDGRFTSGDADLWAWILAG